MVALGRPKGFRRSYQQWLEGNIAPQVVFEILSPSNRGGELIRKQQFYERYCVQEYYVFDPDTGEAYGFHRVDGVWTRINNLQGWVSPLLKIRFKLVGMDLEVYGRDNRRFSTLDEVYQERAVAEENAKRALSRVKREEQRADKEKQRAEQEKQRAEQEKQRAEQEKQRAEQEKQRAEQLSLENQRLLAQLKSLGIEPGSK